MFQIYLKINDIGKTFFLVNYFKIRERDRGLRKVSKKLLRFKLKKLNYTQTAVKSEKAETCLFAVLK